MSENRGDSIQIVEPNPEWQGLAESEIGILKTLFREAAWLVEIQHVGSTAVPGLAAKPILDLFMGVRSLAEARASIQPLEKLGYQFWKDNPNKEKMFFVKGMPPFGEGRTHHIHIVKFESDYWRARLLFRDYLRDHPDEVARYTHLKYKLMDKHKDDREAYTEAKTDYIASVLKKAGFTEDVLR